MSPEVNDSSDNCQNATTNMCPTTVTYIGYVYIQTSLAVLGIVLNLLNVIVFVSSNAKIPILRYLKALALYDLLSLITLSPTGAIRCIPASTSLEQQIRGIVEVYFCLPFGNFFVTSSILCTVMVSVERLMHVSLKHHQNHPFLKKDFHYYLPFVLINGASFIMNFPFFFSRTLCDDGSIIFTEFGRSFGYKIYLWIRLSVIKVIPLLTVVIVNTCLLIVVVRANLQIRQQQQLQSENASHLQNLRQDQTKVFMTNCGVL